MDQSSSHHGIESLTGITPNLLLPSSDLTNKSASLQHATGHMKSTNIINTQVLVYTPYTNTHHIHTRTHTYIQVYTYVHTIYVHILIYIHIYTHTLTCIPTLTHTVAPTD